MTDTVHRSREVVQQLLTAEWNAVSEIICSGEKKLQPLRERLSELTQALEDFGFMDRAP